MRRNKYGNIKTVLDGIKFDSKKEANRYAELKLLEKAGLITDLELQKVFVLQPSYIDKFGKKERPIKYIADFVYTENGKQVIEDVKSEATRKNKDYRIKKKIMGYQGNHITEV